MRVLLESAIEAEVRELQKKWKAPPKNKKRNTMNDFISQFKGNDVFAKKMKTALKKTMANHIATLKNCGGDFQKREVAKILAEIGY